MANGIYDRSLQSEHVGVKNLTFARFAGAATRLLQPRLIALLSILLFVLLYIFTTPETLGDTPVYVLNILRRQKPSDIWEFGHLLWRPLGYLGWHATQSVTSLLFNGNPVVEIEFVLFAYCFLGGVATTLLSFALARKRGLTTLAAFAVSVSVMVSSAVLDYTQSGASYIPGLAMNLAGLYFLLRALEWRSKRDAMLAGACLALALCLWFPYVLAVPAVIAAGCFLPVPAQSSQDDWEISMRERLRLVGWMLAAAAGVTTLCIGTGLLMCGIHSLPQALQWVKNSGHNMHADRSLLRFPSGVARLFLFLGSGGMELKRFVFGDPYAPLDWKQLFGGVWKIALVFLTFGLVFCFLLRARKNWPVLFVAISAAIPTFLFACIFETSSPERYLPLVGALLLVVCMVWEQRRKMPVPGVLLGFFFVTMIIVNVKAYALDLPAIAKEACIRERIVHAHTRHGGAALVMSLRDPVAMYFSRRPFDPDNQADALPLYFVLDFAQLGKTSWPVGACRRTLRTWDAGGEVWLSKRFRASHPEPDWGWVEGDSPNVTWNQLTSFFQQFEVDADEGGRDGFVRIARTPRNQALLTRTAHGG